MKKTFLAIAACALLLPAGAQAKAKPPTYELEASGNQITTWSQSHAPQFACDASVNGNGSQQLYWQLDDPVRVALFKPKGGAAPLLADPKDPMAEHGFADPIRGVVSAKRESVQQIDAPGGECNGDGGWNGEKPPPDCGSRFGTVGLNFGYGDPSGMAPPTKANSKLLHVRGHYDQFVEGAAPNHGEAESWTGEPLGHTFDDCPFWAATETPAGVDDLLPGGERLPIAKLTKLRKGKALKVSGGDRIEYVSGDFNGDTASDWKLEITRVG
jgi:hypothetical protein